MQRKVKIQKKGNIEEENFFCSIIMEDTKIVRSDKIKIWLKVKKSSTKNATRQVNDSEKEKKGKT